jgi:ABC-2 type transport system permease protein
MNVSATEPDLVLRAPAPTGRWPGTIVARQTARKAVRSGALWGAIFALYVAESALGYVSLYKTAAQRAHLAATFGSSGAASALIGPAHQIQTVAGFTAWRSLGVLSVVGAVWGLLTGTKLLRGEEEAGRWELLLAGQTTRSGAGAQALVGLVAGVAALWTFPALVGVLVGRSSKFDIAAGAALFLALALVSSAVVFLAAGALASQLAATRRQAAAYAGTALGVSYLMRMVADSGTGLDWLRWLTPLGWVEELQPLTAPHPLALLPIAGLTAVFAGLAVFLAGARDLGARTLPDRGSTQPHTRLLSGPAGLTLRLVRPMALGWVAAIAGMAVVFGLIAKSAKGAFSSGLRQEFSRLGAPGTGADAYLGVGFLIGAVLVALVAAGQISALRAEEAEGRLDHLLVRPVARWSWLTGRLGVAIAVIVVSGMVAGVCAWLGAASQHAGVSFASVLEAGFNIAPPAICVLGIGILVLGVWPRATSVAIYGVLAWSFLVEFIGGIVGLNHWVLDTSVFHQMASAPAVAPNWSVGAVLVAIGATTALLGGVAFGRRDLAGE